jgi:DNA-directed RNA polymerase alpha subunit
MAKLVDLKEENGIMTFTMHGIDVSYINALRRTILSDIPIVAFKTSPYEENKANIIFNTSRLNNEIVKQRLSCIPICISDFANMKLKNYLLEIDVENNTDTIMMVTTKDFKIRNLETNALLDDNELKKIFPPFVSTTGHEYYIDFLRLRPRLSPEIPGERIKLTCEFSVSTAREDSMFNISGTCSYGYTPDLAKIEEELEKRKQKWKDEGKNEKEIRFEAANWKLLEGLRYVIKDSFDFIIESVGIYENTEIIIHACNILNAKFEELGRKLSENVIDIHEADSTMENCYDIILENEDYTIGNILNYENYNLFYSNLDTLSYVGFKKMHPHDSDSILRMALKNSTDGISDIKTMLNETIRIAMQTIQKIKGCFDGSRDKKIV